MSEPWLEREALVTVKAYPNPSAKYFETVCVAAVTREEGWIRLHPVGFRSLPENQRFKKYQLIKLRMKKHDRDQRAESFRPDEQSIQLCAVVNTKDMWNERWRWIRPTIDLSMCDLLHKDGPRRSLACIRPREISEFDAELVSEAWSGRKQDSLDQMVLFDPVETKLEKIPFVFRYRYRCESPACNGHFQSIIDWELMERYRKVRDEKLSQGEIVGKLREKFLGELCGPTRDTHFFVGNHSRYPNTFMVLGVFWPPRSPQSQLF